MWGGRRCRLISKACLYTWRGKPGSWASGTHTESTETISQGRRIQQDWKRREELYSTWRRRREGEKDLGPFILNKHPGRDEKSPGGTERESDRRRLGSAFCSELRGSPLQVPHHSRVKMVVVGFLRQGTLDCPPLPLGLCVACRGNRSSPRGGQECGLSGKLRRSLAVEGWRVELPPNHRRGGTGGVRGV